MALIQRGTDNGVCTVARTALTGVGLRAGIPVIARGSIRLRWITANPRRRVAGPHIVALIQRRADNGVCTVARTALAGVGLRTGIPVTARGPIRLFRITANPRRRVAGSGIMALIQSRADNGIRSDTRTSRAGIR